MCEWLKQAVLKLARTRCDSVLLMENQAVTVRLDAFGSNKIRPAHRLCSPLGSLGNQPAKRFLTVRHRFTAEVRMTAGLDRRESGKSLSYPLASSCLCW